MQIEEIIMCGDMATKKSNEPTEKSSFQKEIEEFISENQITFPTRLPAFMWRYYSSHYWGQNMCYYVCIKIVRIYRMPLSQNLNNRIIMAGNHYTKMYIELLRAYNLCGD
jgi:hypothetical protein